MIYVIPGNPIPLARHRHHNNHTWDSQKEAKLGAGLFLTNQHGNKPFFSGPIQMCFWFYLPCPVKSPHLAGTDHYIKPDLSNLIKFAEDISTGILYKDDCIITSISACKRYAAEPRTEIQIMEL